MPDQPLPAAAGRLRPALLAWYDRNGRALPWRSDRGPWGVLVSEVMLQQTQVARVLPAWTAFRARFPTPRALAEAPVSEAVTLWRGLGYNRRAVRLHQSAGVIGRRHGGAVPPDLGALLALPGVGAYTARAVLAFAFDAPVAPVDTNVARVLRRAVAGVPVRGRGLQGLADAMVPADAPGDWSQALMDLGAGVCTASTPRCPVCPLAADCVWRAGGGQDPGRSTERAPAPAFAGSDRYHRGRLVDALRTGPVLVEELSGAAALTGVGQTEAGTARTERLERLVTGLIHDGLAEWSDGRLQLPAP